MAYYSRQNLQNNEKYTIRFVSKREPGMLLGPIPVSDTDRVVQQIYRR